MIQSAYLRIISIENNNHCLFARFIYGNLVLVLCSVVCIVADEITLIDMMVAFNQNDEFRSITYSRMSVLESSSSEYVCGFIFCHFSTITFLCLTVILLSSVFWFQFQFSFALQRFLRILLIVFFFFLSAISNRKCTTCACSPLELNTGFK